MITKRGVHKSSEQDLLHGRSLYVTEKDKTKYNWDEIPAGSKFVDELTGFEKVKVKKYLVDSSSNKPIGYGVIIKGKVYQIDGVTPINKANGNQYLSSEVIYAPSEDWIPTGRKYEGTLCITRDIMIIRESFTIINGKDPSNNLVYVNSDGQVKTSPITAVNTSVFELSNTYTLGRNHLQVHIDDSRDASVVDKGIIELTPNRFAVLEEMHNGMVVTATYLHIVDTGNPYPRIFLTKNMPEEAEVGDLWIDLDSFINTDLGKFIDKTILSDEPLDGGLQPNENHIAPNDVEPDTPTIIPSPKKKELKLIDSRYKMSEVFPNEYTKKNKIEEELDMSALTKADEMFKDTTSLDSVDLSYCDMKKVKSTKMMFANSLSGASASVSLANAELSSVENMSGMFQGCNAGIIDMSSTNTSKNKNMSHMFNCDNAFAIMLTDFVTSRVTDMSSAFNCKNLKTLDLSSFDTSKVVNMASMFKGCERLKSLDVSMFDTSRVTNMSSMFSNMKSVTKLDISNFNTSKVTDMSNMFSGCAKLKEVNGVIDMSSLKDAQSAKDMFKGTSVTHVKLKNVPAAFRSAITKAHLGLSNSAVLDFQ